jgi:hypothetical protein
MNQADDLKKEAAKALEDFQANAPFTADFTATQALDQIAAMRAHLNMLKAQEAEIRKGLGIFKIDHPMSKDLQALEKVRGSQVFVLYLFSGKERKNGCFTPTHTKAYLGRLVTLYRHQRTRCWLWGSKYGHCPIRVLNQRPFYHWPNPLINCANRAHPLFSGLVCVRDSQVFVVPCF